MWIADAMLLGNRVARDNWFGIIYCGKRIAIVADSHEQTMGGVTKVGEEIGAHILFCKHLLWLSSRCVSCKE